MAGVSSKLVMVGLKSETTEGVYTNPGAGDVIQIVEIPKPEPMQERIPRNLVSGSFGEEKELAGRRGGTLPILTEFRGAGVTSGESDQPENHLILLNALGLYNKPTSTTVSGSGSTTTVIDVASAAGVKKGDIVLINGQVRFVTAVNTAATPDNITLNAPLSGAPAASDAVKFGHAYRPATTTSDYGSLSAGVWFDAAVSGPQFRGIGARVEKLAVKDFEVGKIPKLEATLKLLDYAWANAETAPASPVFEDQLPPVGIYGVVLKDGTAIAVEKIELELTNEIPEEGDINAASGKVRQYQVARKITGKFDPAMQQGSIALQNLYENNTTFELMLVLGIRSSGLFTQGTCVGIWLPQVTLTKAGLDDKDGLMKHEFAFKTHQVAGGVGNDDAYFGVV